MNEAQKGFLRATLSLILDIIPYKLWVSANGVGILLPAPQTISPEELFLEEMKLLKYFLSKSSFELFVYFAHAQRMGIKYIHVRVVCFKPDFRYLYVKLLRNFAENRFAAVFDFRKIKALLDT